MTRPAVPCTILLAAISVGHLDARAQGRSQPQPGTLSRIMPRCTRAEAEAPGYVPADGGQVLMCLAQCETHPDVLVMGEDVGGPWLSLDHGRSWWLPRRRGLRSRHALGAAIDPRHPEVLYASSGHNGVGLRLFRSTDGGRSWENLTDRVPDCCSCGGLEVSPVTGDVICSGSNGTYVIPPPYQQEGTIFSRLRHGNRLLNERWRAAIRARSGA